MFTILMVTSLIALVFGIVLAVSLNQELQDLKKKNELKAKMLKESKDLNLNEKGV